MNTNWTPAPQEHDDNMTDLDMDMSEVWLGIGLMALLGGVIGWGLYMAWTW